MDMQWQSRPVGLRFMLGELPLCKATFRMLRLENHFTDLEQDVDDSRFELTHLPPGVHGLHVRSHPIGDDFRIIKHLPWGIRYASQTYTHFYVDLTGGFDAYLKGRNRKSMQEIERKIRRFRDFCGGSLDLREYRREDEVEEFYRLAREVSAKTYQERLLRSGLPDNQDYPETLRDLARNGGLRGNVLFCAGRPIAYALARNEDGIVMGQYLGYDSEYAKWSPGTILEYCRLERFFSEGVYRMFDYGQGASDYKRTFATGSVRCADLYYFRKSLKAALLVHLHRGCEVFGETVGRCLQATGLKMKLRKALRSKALLRAGECVVLGGAWNWLCLATGDVSYVA